MDCNSSVVTNPEYFQDEYLPDEIVNRESQVGDLMTCLKPVFQRQKPVHAWIYGKAGTGKTMIARYVIKKIESKANVKSIYINCWTFNTYYSILEKVIRELRIIDAEKPDTGYKIERIRQCIEEKPMILVLDEIDHLKHSEIETLLFNVDGIKNCGVICIGNTASFLFAAEERIRSRFNAKIISCPPYPKKELLAILQNRAFSALGAGTWKEEHLAEIVGLSKGDARTAIQLLRNAAYNAEKERMKGLEPRHIKMGYTLSDEVKKDFLVERLTGHQRLIYELVKKRKEIFSSELWKTYCRACPREKLHPLSQRSFTDICSKMVDLGLIRWDRAPLRGRIRIFRVVE